MELNNLDYRLIDFGKTDAHKESSENPELLITGYYDSSSLVEKALDNATFLFLGYKGSGKTALSEHLSLTKTSADMWVDQEKLLNFPYNKFSKIESGDGEVEFKSKKTWRWILLLKVFYNILQTSATSNDPDRVAHLSSVLTECGLFPVKGIGQLVTKSSTKQFKIGLKGFCEYSQTQQFNTEAIFLSAIEALEEIIFSYSIIQRQMLVIDGLDEVLTTKENQYIILAALLNEVKDLNEFFISEGLPIKFIVLCRTDIFEKLPDPNKNKLRQDCSFTLNWYKEGVDTQQNCGLVEIANLRAKISFPEITDIFLAFFPSEYNKQDIYSALLDFTRHTPRDFLTLLSYIQKQCSQKTVKIDNITKGIVEYSCNYFLPEIKDEMVGYVPFDRQEDLLDLMSVLRKREFYLSELLSHDTFNSIDMTRDELIKYFRSLYECSAIGNKYSRGEQTRYSFKYRNRSSRFNPEEQIVLHKGLWKALNVNY